MLVGTKTTASTLKSQDLGHCDTNIPHLPTRLVPSSWLEVPCCPPPPLVGQVLAALQAWDPVVGLVVGSYQGCSEGLHALAREVAEERARTEWRQTDGRSERAPEALGIFVHDVHRRWGSVFWRSWARVIRGRLPAIGRPNAEILHHGEEVV